MALEYLLVNWAMGAALVDSIQQLLSFLVIPYLLKRLYSSSFLLQLAILDWLKQEVNAGITRCHIGGVTSILPPASLAGQRIGYQSVRAKRIVAGRIFGSFALVLISVVLSI